MTDTVTSARSGPTEGVHLSSSNAPFRITKINPSEAVIKLSDKNIAHEELNHQVTLLKPEVVKFIFDMTQVSQYAALFQKVIAPLVREHTVELVTTPEQYQKLLQLNIHKLPGSIQLTQASTEDVGAQDHKERRPKAYNWASSLIGPTVPQETQVKPEHLPAPPSTARGTTEVRKFEGYVEIIPPSDILLNEKSRLALAEYVKSLETNQEGDKLNLLKAQTESLFQVTTVLLDISAHRQRLKAPPLKVSLPEAVKQQVMNQCRDVQGLSFS